MDKSSCTIDKWFARGAKPKPSYFELRRTMRWEIISGKLGPDLQKGLRDIPPV
jgi:hypothetical protein